MSSPFHLHLLMSTMTQYSYSANDLILRSNVAAKATGGLRADKYFPSYYKKYIGLLVGGRKCIQHNCRPQGCVQCTLVESTDCKHNFGYKRNPQGPFKVSFSKTGWASCSRLWFHSYQTVPELHPFYVNYSNFLQESTSFVPYAHTVSLMSYWLSPFCNMFWIHTDRIYFFPPVPLHN